MIQIYDTQGFYPEQDKNSILLEESTDFNDSYTPNHLWALINKSIKKCEKDYNVKSFYIRSILFGNTKAIYEEDENGKEICIEKPLHKYYYVIDWGHHWHFLHVTFDKEEDYNAFINWQQKGSDTDNETN